MENIAKFNQDFELWMLLRQTALIASKVRERELKKYNISTSQSAVLDCIKSSNNNASPTQISRWLFREAQSVSMILNRMEKGGLIIRTPDPKRKNLVRISITEKGENIFALISAKRESIGKIMRSLTEEERHKLKNYLEKFQKAAREQL